MEAVVLIGGLLYIAVVGYLAMDRLGRFWDKGGISPYWDEAEEQQAQDTKKEPVNSGSFGEQEGCNPLHSKVV